VAADLAAVVAAVLAAVEVVEPGWAAAAPEEEAAVLQVALAGLPVALDQVVHIDHIHLHHRGLLVIIGITDHTGGPERYIIIQAEAQAVLLLLLQ
jgi:hypothetical protein